MGLRMIKAQGGILGWVTDSSHIINAAANAGHQINH
jgi:hypothetical protein